MAGTLGDDKIDLPVIVVFLVGLSSLSQSLSGIAEFFTQSKKVLPERVA
jgi:hypothetical protein